MHNLKHLAVLMILSMLPVFGLSQDTTYYCDDWAQEPVEAYLLENNVWGKGNIEDYSQCIYLTESNSFGWTWDWPSVGNNVKAYPEVIFGRKPWSSESTHPSLPARISSIETFSVAFDVEMSATGIYNLAYDFWLTTDSLSDATDINTEVMIWIDQATMWPAGYFLGSHEIDGFTYDLYKADWDQWTYIAFTSQEVQYSGVLNVEKFLDIMVDQELIDSTNYFASFELGNEVISGSGWASVSQFEIAVNGVFSDIFEPGQVGDFTLHQNYPNPFNPSTNVRYQVAGPADVTISIFNIAGQHVRTLVSAKHNPGLHEVTWDGTNEKGQAVSSGVYFYSIQTNGLQETRKMLLTK